RRVVETRFNLTGSTSRPMRVVQCTYCDLQYIDPLPSPVELENSYRADYGAYSIRLAFGRELSAEQISINRRLCRMADQRLNLLRRQVPSFHQCARVLDVGCGNGAFLIEMARHSDAECWGMDVSSGSLERLAADAKGRLHLVRGDLRSNTVPEG